MGETQVVQVPVWRTSLHLDQCASFWPRCLSLHGLMWVSCKQEDWRVNICLIGQTFVYFVVVLDFVLPSLCRLHPDTSVLSMARM